MRTQTQTKTPEKQEPLFHHWLGLLAKRYKTTGEYSPEEIHEISNLALSLTMDVDKEMHQQRSAHYSHN